LIGIRHFPTANPKGELKLKVKRLEENAMEKSWEDFAETGKVTDYLAYRGVLSETLSRKWTHFNRRMDCEAAAEWQDIRKETDE
jgi:hypothetical protein